MHTTEISVTTGTKWSSNEQTLVFPLITMVETESFSKTVNVSNGMLGTFSWQSMCFHLLDTNGHMTFFDESENNPK